MCTQHLLPSQKLAFPLAWNLLRVSIKEEKLLVRWLHELKRLCRGKACSAGLIRAIVLFFALLFFHCCIVAAAVSLNSVFNVVVLFLLHLHRNISR